ncbi:MAG: glycoside hydrolase family 2, partial [Treponema sp.]|nr:glycoside hydrolase family 2 [Treponema sp.]
MLKIHQRPEIQQINRLPMRSPLIPYPTQKEAEVECAQGPENIAFTKSQFAKSLDGKWKFFLQDSADADENSNYSNWTQMNFNDKNWRQINVPGTWTLQESGDIPHYTNVQMPWTTLPPFVPK